MIDFSKLEQLKQHSTYNFCRELAIKEAYDASLKVVSANDQTLQLDVDNEADLEHAKKMLRMMTPYFPFSVITYTRSKSNKWHLYVHLLKPVAIIERILLQACLGSDRKRELLNFLYQHEGNTGEPLFFEKKNSEHELLKL